MTPRVALVHDWLEAPGGGELVFRELRHLYPHADVYALVDFLTTEERRALDVDAVNTSLLQRLPFAQRWFRYAAALWPQLIERFDLSGYDAIVSDSHAVAKGVRKAPHQRHLCYCHSPARFAWAMADLYGARAAPARFAGPLVAQAMARFRRWDVRVSARVDHFVANSRHTAAAIHARYGRDADVVFPPVDIQRFTSVGNAERRGYVTVSRLVPYKRTDLILEAFARMPGRSLTVIGDGPERAALERTRPANVTLAGRLPDDEVARRVGEARAFVFAAQEDFGIAVVEALAAGTPVIALDEGGVREIVRGLDDAAPTGVLFRPQDAGALVHAVETFEAHAARIASQACRDRAAQFAPARFRAAFAAVASRVGIPASAG